MLFTRDNSPGMAVAINSEEVALTKVGRFGYRPETESLGDYIKSSVTDSGNTPTTVIRAGTIMAKQTADGKLYVYSPYANDGTQLAVGILDHYTDMLVNSVATDKWVSLLTGGLLQTSAILNSDVQAQAVLYRNGFRSDALTPPGSLFLLRHRKRQLKSTDYTVTAADDGDLIVATGAANFTLPTKALGLQFEFLQTADANMAILSAGSADDIIVDGDAGADSVTYSTSSHKIGSRCLVECIAIDTSGTLRWIITNLGGTTQTIA